MYKSVITLCLLFFLVQNSDRTIPWSSTYRLEWSDFKGKVVESKSVAAVTASGITFSYGSKKSNTELIDYHYNVVADFYPDNSWYHPKRINDFILEHERLHFDITELHARKFRKQLANTNFTIDNIDSKMQLLYDTIQRDLKEMQELYDKETRHSINKEKQREWEAKVEVMLNKLSYYSS